MKLHKRSAVFNLGAIAKIGTLSITTFLLLGGFLSLGAQALNPVNGTSGTCAWNIDSDGNMVIKPTSGDECMLANATSGSSMTYHPYRNSITSIKFEGRVKTNIGARSLFYNMTNLTEIDLTGFDTSNATNMQYMFNKASSLTELDLSGFNTSNVTTMDSMFDGASSLTSINLSSFDTSKVIDMHAMFGGTSSLASIDISHFDTSNVETMRGMFYNSSSLTSLDLSNFDTSKVRTMRSMFAGCSSLESLKIPSFDTSNVTSMYGMFSRCSSLTSLDLSSFDTSSVTDMYGMFASCSGLKSLDLSNFDTTNVTDMYGMFDGASHLISLNLSSFDTSNVSNMNEFFDDAVRLQEIILGAETDLKGNVVGRGLWRNEDDGTLHRGIEIERGPGDFVNISDVADNMTIKDEVDYRIGQVSQISEFDTTNSEIFTMSEDKTTITATLPLEKVDEYSIPGTVDLLFKGVVSDKDGNKYDLKMTYENITLYDLNLIEEDLNVIYAPILDLDAFPESSIYIKSGIYYNYDGIGLVSGQANVSRSYDITFSVLKDGSPVEGSYLFSAYDLDGPSYRDRDPDTGERGYGDYSEGISLEKGFELDTVILSEDTMLRKVGNNRYTGTGPDNFTEKSEFIVKASASEAKFTWTTGGSMSTALFVYYQPNIVEVAKKDQYGDFVAGATLAVSQDDRLKQTWTSALEPERLWLNPGLYRLKETAAPEGYEKSDKDMELIVGSNSILVDGEIADLVTVTNQKIANPDEEPDDKPDEKPDEKPSDQQNDESKDELPVPDTGVNTGSASFSTLGFAGLIVTGVTLVLVGLAIKSKRN